MCLVCRVLLAKYKPFWWNNPVPVETSINSKPALLLYCLSSVILVCVMCIFFKSHQNLTFRIKNWGKNFNNLKLCIFLFYFCVYLSFLATLFFSLFFQCNLHLLLKKWGKQKPWKQEKVSTLNFICYCCSLLLKVNKLFVLFVVSWCVTIANHSSEDSGTIKEVVQQWRISLYIQPWLEVYGFGASDHRCCIVITHSAVTWSM